MRDATVIDFGTLAERIAARVSAANAARGELERGRRFALGVARALADLRDRCDARGVPTRGPTWDGMTALQPTAATRFIDGAMRARRLLIVLGGDVGAGKTVALARAVARVATVDDVAPLYVAAGPLAEAVAHPYDKPRQALDRRAETAPFLAIDDLGTERVTDESLRLLRGVLGRRVDAGLRTLVSTNLQWSDPNGGPSLQRDYLDRRLLDRFAESGAYTHFRGKSFRRAKER